MTGNVITYSGKSAAREVGKALGFDLESLGRFIELGQQLGWRGQTDTMRILSKCRLDIQHRASPVPRLSMRIQDLPRHFGNIRAAWHLPGHLTMFVPLERASMPGPLSSNGTKKIVLTLGIIKVDLLASA